MNSRATTLPPIPEPQLQVVENGTPFQHLAFDKMGKGRLFYDVVIVKATFELAPGELQPSAQPVPIALADRYWDEQNVERSSVKVAGDVLLTKPYTDILVVGHARTYDGVPRKSWDAGIRVSAGGRVEAEHLMRLTGPRSWIHSALRGWHLGGAAAADCVSLRHENAYGGHSSALYPDDARSSMVDESNPSGCGHWDLRRLDKSRSYIAPQLESITHPTKHIGAGYPMVSPAPLARFWNDRKRFGGTYDAAWQHQFSTHPIPDYPHDFDTRFFQCAHPNLICKSYLGSGARISLIGLTKGSQTALSCTLPRFALEAELVAVDSGVARAAFCLDTVLIDLDNANVSLTWRLTLDQRLGVENVVIERPRRI